MSTKNSILYKAWWGKGLLGSTGEFHLYQDCFTKKVYLDMQVNSYAFSIRMPKKLWPIYGYRGWRV